MSKFDINTPGLTNCMIVPQVSILKFLYSVFSMSLFKFQINLQPPPVFSLTNIGEVNSPCSGSDGTINFFWSKDFSNFLRKVFSICFNGYWKLWIGWSFELTLMGMPQNVCRTSGSNVMSVRFPKQDLIEPSLIFPPYLLRTVLKH